MVRRSQRHFLPKVAEDGQSRPKVTKDDWRRPKVAEDGRRPYPSQRRGVCTAANIGWPVRMHPEENGGDQRSLRMAEVNQRLPRMAGGSQRQPKAAEDGRRPYPSWRQGVCTATTVAGRRTCTPEENGGDLCTWSTWPLYLVNMAPVLGQHGPCIWSTQPLYLVVTAPVLCHHGPCTWSTWSLY